MSKNPNTLWSSYMEAPFSQNPPRRRTSHLSHHELRENNGLARSLASHFRADVELTSENIEVIIPQEMKRNYATNKAYFHFYLRRCCLAGPRFKRIVMMGTMVWAYFWYLEESNSFWAMLRVMIRSLIEWGPRSNEKN